MAYELQGKVIKIDDVQTFGSGFTKREFVVRTEEQYPQDIKFELVKDKTALLDSYKLGDAIKVSFDIRGSEWQGKHFVNLTAWRLDGGSSAAAAPAPGKAAAASAPAAVPPPPGDVFDPGDAAEDDLPF
jgi:hypothetical protein